MRNREACTPFVAALLVVGLLLPAAALAADAPAAEAPPAPAAGEAGYWALAFENDTPKQLVLEDPTGKLRFFWYLIYRVKNPESKPLPPRVKLSLRLALAKEATDYTDSFDRVAETHLEQKVLERPVCNWAELRAEPLKPGESREAVAIFPMGKEAPDFDKMTISVRGLAELRPLGREGSVRKFRERVLLLKYEQVASQWRAGKELKYLPEEWELEEVALTDRTETEAEASDKLGKRLQELLEKAKAEEERRRKIIEQPPKPPDKSSAQPDAPALGVGGPVSGRPAPELLATLHKLAAEMPCVRATFTETLGRDERRQETACTLCLNRQGKFAIERNLSPGTPQAIKEHRVFDGRTLWIHTVAKGVGDTVRRWTVAETRKQWHAVDGRPEVSFAAIVNPLRAWRLFGSDLVYLGTERLERETAYIFEARPAKALEGVLAGPLSSELLGKTAGHRARFWIGADSALQLKMHVYGDRDQVVATLECGDVKFDDAISPDAFAFKPPAGVEVVDMNAAFAANDKPAQPAPQPHN